MNFYWLDSTSPGNLGLKTDVQAWLDDPSSNFGWIFVGEEGISQSCKRFDTRENTGSSPIITVPPLDPPQFLPNRPELTVTYTPPSATGACCFVTGACANRNADDCAAQGGSHLGDGTTCETSCAGNTCQAAAACCFNDGTCSLLDYPACSAQGGSYQGSVSTCGPDVCPLQLTPFVDDLPIPPVAQPVSGTPGQTASYQIPITQFQQRLHRDLPLTTLWGYGGTYLGPTIEAGRNQTVTVTWINDLRDSSGQLLQQHHLPVDTCMHGPDVEGPTPRTVVHLHGAHVAAAYDGYPEDTILPGESDVYIYPNNQLPATLWYHDHALGITRLNVYMGLAGFYLIRDAQEQSLILPSGPYEIPLAIQDKKFRSTGEIVYPETWEEEFFGDKILVNGKVWPKLNVNRGKYRFRVVNASNSRTYQLALSNGASFHQIGTDGGLLLAPVQVSEVTLMPGERADLVVDFAPRAPAPFPGTPGVGVIPDVMKFVVSSAVGYQVALPAALRAVAPLVEADAAMHREFEVMKVPNPCGGSAWSIDGLSWDQVTEYPILGTTEVWSFTNRSGFSHPMHLHLVMFQVLDRQNFEVVNDEVVPIGPRYPPAANEAGWKDTVQVHPNQITRVITRFETYEGLYPFHCHLLEHEDHEMMRQFQTISCACDDNNPCTDATCAPPQGCIFTVRSGACEDGNACTTGEVCVGSVCTPGPALNCDDDNICTADSCNPASGCVYAEVGGLCDDANPCTTAEICLGGLCSARILQPSGTFPAAGVAAGASIASGDLNRDGKLDLVDPRNVGISILLGDAAGGFTEGTALAATTTPFATALGDFNGDGKLDLAVALDSISGINNVKTYLGQGDGTFQAPQTYSASAEPRAIAVADLNRDGRLDLAIANWNSNGVSPVTILLGSAGGGFVPGTTFSVGQNPADIVAEDFNLDGIIDLAVPSYWENHVQVRIGNGSGGFTFGSVTYGIPRPMSLASGDFNGDGRLDLVTANESESASLSILLGNAGGFNEAPGSPMMLPGVPRYVTVGDLDGDGTLDLAVTGFTNDLTLLLGNGSGQFSLAPASSYAMGTALASVVLGDFNRDGSLDAAASVANSVSVLLNHTIKEADPALLVQAAGSPVTLGTSPYMGALADFDRNGKLDIAVPNRSSNNTTILLANGSGGFSQAAGSPVPVGTGPVSAAAGDFNRDGMSDLAIANFSSNNVTVLLGDGSGGFAPALGSPVAVGQFPQSLTAADFDKDGRLDIAVANASSDNVTILVGNGAGGFSPSAGSPVAVGDSPMFLASADWNLDGRTDLAAANNSSSNVTILLGNGVGGFSQAPGSPIATGAAFPTALAVGDMNRDGKPDFALAENNRISILLGNGSGGFTQAPGSPIALSHFPWFVALADLTGDGKLDLGVADGSNNRIAIRPGNGSGGFGPSSVLFATGQVPHWMSFADWGTAMARSMLQCRIATGIA